MRHIKKQMNEPTKKKKTSNIKKYELLGVCECDPLIPFTQIAIKKVTVTQV